MDENMKKWPQAETGSQTGEFTFLPRFFRGGIELPIDETFQFKKTCLP